MTRKEIEKRCREAMEQNLPDKDALWMRIESSLPAQSAPPAVEEPPKRKISVIYRTVAAAACFLFVAGGLMLYGISRMPSKNAETAPMLIQENEAAEDRALYDNAVGGAPAAKQEQADAQYKSGLNADIPAHQNYAPECDMAAEEAAQEQAYTLTYAELQVPQTNTIAANTDRSKLQTGGDAFSEEAVLKKTQVIAKAEVTKGVQDPGTGVMRYTIKLLDCYRGAEDPQVEMSIESSSPYLLEQAHVYVLPLTKTEDGWALSFPDAPQIEVTLDGRLLCHSGWTSLLQNGRTPVICEPQTEDDCYYDRMYLTDTDNLDALLDVWESLQ